MSDDERWMRVAMARCREGIAAGQTPFGAVVVRDSLEIASAHNTVWQDGDSTAHAEINALRAAEAGLRTVDLSGSTVYTTCEPCPMCLAAIHWAKVSVVVFGARIEDAAGAGFSEMPISAETMVALGKSPLLVRAEVLREECAGLFAEWKASGNARKY